MSSSSFSQLNLNSAFSSGGLAFDGSSYQLLLESDADRGAGNEIFLAPIFAAPAYWNRPALTSRAHKAAPEPE